MSEKIQATHLSRKAIVYLRQSTMRQVHEHRESTARQYDLRRRALDLGFDKENIEVIDEDLGRSGSSTEGRSGFQRLAEDVAHGRVGAILALEASRFARSSADWHRLLELCALADVAIADESAVYHPRDYNDRLLLGLKGTMSEAEQYWMRLRLGGGKLSKARRGELWFLPPPGYEWDPSLLRFRLDPDERVQKAIRLVFARFRVDGSAHGVARFFMREGLQLPCRDMKTRELEWDVPKDSLVLSILHNPAYAGAYVYGRNENRIGLVDGKLRRRCLRRLPMEQWQVLLKGRHEGYVTWEEFLDNQKKIEDNLMRPRSPQSHGAAREGRGLLQGLLMCGVCGHRMMTRYHGNDIVQYQCYTVPAGPRQICWAVSGAAIDHMVEELFLAAVGPPEIELALAVAREVERQARELDKQWQLRLDRLTYEARLAERRYKAVDPDNRVVARTLESEWNEKLRAVTEAEHELLERRKHEKLVLGEQDRERVLALAKDLPAVWRAPTTMPAERKNLLRMLIRDIVLSPVTVPSRMTRIQIWWQTGAVTDLSIPRRTPYTAQQTPEEIEQVVKRLATEKQSDESIAAELNRLHLPRAVGRPWDKVGVRHIRYMLGLFRMTGNARPAPKSSADGMLSARGVAEQLSVRPSLINTWARSGLLKIEGKTGRRRWFKLDEATLKRLETAKARHP